MDKMMKLFFAAALLFVIACNTAPDVDKEVKTIDSLQTVITTHLDICIKMDTSWVRPVTEKSNYNVKTLKKVYDSDSIDPVEAKMVTYYKGFRKVGRKFLQDREMFITEFNKSIKQLEDLKTDAVNGALKKEDILKYINDEKLVTTDLIYKFNDFKGSTEYVVKNFDSLNPLIENIIEVYSAKYKERINKGGITIH